MPSAANQPTFVHSPISAPTPITLSVSPLTSPGVPNASTHQSQGSMTPATLTNVPLPPQQRRRTGLFIMMLLLLLILLGGGGYLTFLHFRNSSTAGIGVTQIGHESIGISDGSFAFDTTLADGSLNLRLHRCIDRIVTILIQLPRF